VAGPSCDFAKDPEIREASDDLVRAGERGTDQSLNVRDAHDRLLVEALQHSMTVPGCPAELLCDRSAMLLAEFEDSACSAGSFHAHLCETA
jgi:hypothetical protein